ncbi:hypothetical protein [Streptomyces scopuliridis]|uniref:Uncharacterized protein n=1 Tax=Streptomyces scopuliridis TaxID=452529 RepID=A0ACD4ZV79_9ACTN|nr:hypothetical protein [Streptomyces scopuliridis]WSC02385.1 hypothetical protein OG835_38875 [Streptomyces scopuliridis]
MTHTMRVSVGVGWFQAVATSRGGMGRVSIVRSTVGSVRGERDGVVGARGRRLDKGLGAASGRGDGLRAEEAGELASHLPGVPGDFVQQSAPQNH